MKNAKFLSLSLMLLAVGSKKPEQVVNAPSSKAQRMFVAPQAGLRMRSAPNTQARIIVTIPHNAEVSVVEESNKTLTVSGTTGKWMKVTYKGSTGWVFGGFLSPKAAGPGGWAELVDLADSTCWKLSDLKTLILDCANGDETYAFGGNGESYSVLGFNGTRVNWSISKVQVDGCDAIFYSKAGEYTAEVEILYTVRKAGRKWLISSGKFDKNGTLCKLRKIN